MLKYMLESKQSWNILLYSTALKDLIVKNEVYKNAIQSGHTVIWVLYYRITSKYLLKVTTVLLCNSVKCCYTDS